LNVAATKSTNLPDMSIRIMLRVLEESGYAAGPALEAAGLPDGLPELPGDITAQQEFRFQCAFAAITGFRPDLWVRTGIRYRLPSYGTLGLALMTSPSLLEFMNTSVDGQPLNYSLADITPIVSQNFLRGQRIETADVPESIREFTIYRDMAATVMALQEVSNDHHFPIKRIELTVPRPSSAEFTILGHAVEFNCENNAIIWDRDISHRPLSHGDPLLHAAYMANVRNRTRLKDTSEDLIEILCAAMLRGNGEAPTLGELAAETGSTERTLQRRLFARGLRFRDLLEEARRRVSLELLTSSDLSVSEIAWRLGYREPTSFNHAFRRWTGGSPAAVRRARRGD
jgi:AraC-like DNA-binding protein